ncbi:hypothetical protein [Paracoccus pacificus]|uniref:Lipoprotein n=1 Tax=Paracoccus pacificus TaxID=1463598 RepID=A0ABW4R5T6_9RHOB
MSKKVVLAMVLAGVAFTAACQKREETVVTPAPVTVEPVYQGKYGPN